MLRNKWTLLALILSLVIIFIGHQRRSVAYSTVPDGGILDELSYAWVGMSLRQTGIPVGWSDSGVYHGGDINKRGQVGGIKDFAILIDDKSVDISNASKIKKPFYAILDFDIQKQTQSRGEIGIRQIDLVAPFFDHPPLGGLLFSLGVTPETKTFGEVTTFQTRKVSLYLALTTGLLIFIFSQIVTKNPVLGILSVALYNFAPSYFFASRYALLENILTPLSLIFLIILFFAFKQKRRLFLLGLAGAFGGILCLVKESGLGFVIGALILMMGEKSSKKEIGRFLLFFSMPIVLYIIYGLFLSADVFLNVALFNSGRQFWGSLNFLSMLPSLRFRDFPFDGWWIFGYVSVLILSVKKVSIPVGWLIPAISHLILVLFLGGYNYPWYYLALIPYLALATAYILWELFLKPSWGLLIPFFILAFSSSLYWGRAIMQFTPSILEYRLLLGSTIFLGGLANTKKSKKFIFAWRVFFIFLVISIFLLNYKSLTSLMSNWGKDYPSLTP